MIRRINLLLAVGALAAVASGLFAGRALVGRAIPRSIDVDHHLDGAAHLYLNVGGLEDLHPMPRRLRLVVRLPEGFELRLPEGFDLRATVRHSGSVRVREEGPR